MLFVVLFVCVVFWCFVASSSNVGIVTSEIAVGAQGFVASASMLFD